MHVSCPACYINKKSSKSNKFSEHICDPLKRRVEGSRDQLPSNITNKMAIHLYMLGPLVEDKVAIYVNGNLISQYIGIESSN